jgi:transcriptional regulator GlxA family with amidase domain
MDDRLRVIIAFMERTLQNPRPWKEVAAVGGLSPSWMRELFARHLNDSPSRYRKRLRLERARTLLVTAPHLSVKQVMAEVGLADESHFVRDFQAMFGLSPRRYRRRSEGMSVARKNSSGHDQTTSVPANKAAKRPMNGA